MSRRNNWALSPLPLSLGVLVVMGGVLAADVVLNPGFITGTYSIQGVPVTQASLFASSAIGSTSITTTNGTYSLTVNVPSSGSQQYSLGGTLFSDGNRDRMNLPQKNVTVTSGGTVLENIAVTPGFVTGTITVLGSPANVISGSVTAAVTALNASASTSLVAPFTTFAFPVFPGTNTVNGGLNVNGTSVSLPSQQVVVGPGDTVVVNFTVNAPAVTGAVSGNLTWSGVQAPTTVNVRASGATNVGANFTQPGLFTLTGLADGNYSLVGSASFVGQTLNLPNLAFVPHRSFTILAGNHATKDIVLDVREVLGTALVTGPRAPSLAQLRLTATGVSTATSSGSTTVNATLPSGAFRYLLTDGAWRTSATLTFQDFNAASFLNSTMQSWTNLAAASTCTVAAPSSNHPPLSFDLGTVSVVIAVPPPLTLANPNLSGWCEKRVGTTLVEQFFVSASRSISNVSTTTVTFVGTAAACNLTARATVNGASTTIGALQTAVIGGVESNVDIGGPALTLSSPAANFVTTGTGVPVSGTATDDAQVQSVTVNNVTQTLTSTNNPADPREVAFSTTVNLPSLGAHTITTRATDIAGKVTTDTRTVFRKAQPVITWTEPAAIPFGTALSSTQLNAVARVDGVAVLGEMSYTPPAGTVLPVGDDHVLEVTFTPTDQTRYLTAQGTTTIDVFASQPVITWPAPTSVAYGTPLGAGQLNASASLGGSPVAGTFAYSPAAGTVLGAGTHELTVTFTPSDTNYQSATAAVTMTVTRAPLTVTAEDATRPYGAENPAFTASYAGFVLDQNPSALGGALSFATIAEASSPVGTYAVAPSGLTSANYAITYVAGTLSITSGTLEVTAASVERSYGTANPTLTGTISGLLAADGIVVTYQTAADQASPAGTYPVEAVISDPNGRIGNYAVTLTPGTLTVTPAALVVTASSATRAYGQPNPPLEASFNGFVLSQTPADLGGTLDVTTTATASSGIGQYPVTASGLVSTNYAITYVPGTLSVERAQLQAIADDATRAFGEENPEFTGSTTGLLASDGIVVSYTTAATASSPAGEYDIQPSVTDPGGRLANYELTLTSGTLVVTRRALTVTAGDVARTYGTSTPAFSAQYSGFAAGDGPGSLAGTLSFAGAAATATDVGTYSIVPSGVSSANYVITFVDGTLTIAPAPLAVKANDQTRAYGAASAAFTVSYSGLVNGDDPDDLAGTLTFGGTAPGAVNVGSYTIVPGGLSSTNYAVTFVNGALTVTPAGLTIRADDKTMVVGGTLPTFTATYTGFVNGDSPASLDVPAALTTAGTGQTVGSFPIASSGAADANYTITFVPGVLKVEYSSGACLGDAGRSILQPVNVDGSSVFKQKSTVPLKFRVCDASGASVSSGVVSSFLLVQRVAGTATLSVNETPDSTTPDATFRWDAPGQQWIFNLSTKNLQSGQTYRYQIGLADGSVIPFQFGLR